MFPQSLPVLEVQTAGMIHIYKHRMKHRSGCTDQEQTFSNRYEINIVQIFSCRMMEKYLVVEYLVEQLHLIHLIKKEKQPNYS